jgi:hypothetical protein
MPAIIAWRAGFCPAAGRQHLTHDDFADLAATLARARASLITVAPSWVAGILAREPPNLPTAVRRRKR